MAKKVVIGDLVVKVGIDSSGTARQLRQLHSRLGATQRSQNRESRRGVKLEERRVEAAKASLARSREFHKLKKRNHAFAMRAQSEYLRAARRGDRVEMGNWRRRISEQLEHTRNAERAATDRARAIQRDANLRRQVAQQETRRATRAREAELRHARVMARATRERNRMMGRGVGAVGGFTNNAVMGAGMGIMGVGGLTAAATLAATQTTRDFRVGEQLLSAAYTDKGVVGSEAKDRRDALYRQTQYYNLDPATMFGSAGQMMINMPDIDTKVVEKLVMGLGVLGGSMGTANADIKRTMVGTQQFLVSQTAENLNQMTEAMPILLNSVAKALNVSTLELQKAKKEGTLADLVQTAGGKAKFSANLSEILASRGTDLFERNKDKLPNTMKTLPTQVKHAATLFGTEAEGGIMEFINTLSNSLQANEQLFRTAGQWVGIALSQIAESMNKMMVQLQPYIDKWVESWEKMSDEEKAAAVAEALDTIGEAFKALMIAFAVSKVMAVAAAITALSLTFTRFASLLGITGAGAAIGGAAALGPAAIVAGGVIGASASQDWAENAFGDWVGTRLGVNDEHGFDLWRTKAEQDKLDGKPIQSNKPQMGSWGANQPIINLETKTIVYLDAEGKVIREQSFATQTPD